MTDTTTSKSRDDEYVESVLERARTGDPLDVLQQTARFAAINAAMVGNLIRKAQAAYAAGVLHGPEQAFEWIGNSLAGPGFVPEGDRPDPDWFGRAPRFGDAFEPGDIPKNCGSLCEPGTAPATHPLPGITGCDPLRVCEHDGATWITNSYWVLRLFATDTVPVGAKPIDADILFGGLDQKCAGGSVPLVPWVPAGAFGVDHAEIVGNDGFRLVVLSRFLDDTFAYAQPLYWRAVTANIAAGWEADQMGDPLAPIRFTVPSLTDPDSKPTVVAWLMPCALDAGSS